MKGRYCPGRSFFDRYLDHDRGIARWLRSISGRSCTRLKFEMSKPSTASNLKPLSETRNHSRAPQEVIPSQYPPSSMSSISFAASPTAPFQGRGPRGSKQIPSQIEFLAIICQDPQVREHRLALNELESIILYREQCENDTATPKAIVSCLFQTITNPRTISPELPLVVAQLANSILSIIPDTLRDYTRPAEEAMQGKALYLQLLLEGLNFYRNPGPQLNGYGDIDHTPVYSYLSQPVRLQLSDFIRELADLELIDPLVIYGFLLKFLHWIEMPTPTPWELECACRLLRTRHDDIREVLWTDAVLNALEIIRGRDGARLEQRIRVQLLVLTPCRSAWLISRKQYG